MSLLGSCAPDFMLGFTLCGALMGGVIGYLIGRMRRGRRERHVALQAFNRWRGQK